MNRLTRRIASRVCLVGKQTLPPVKSSIETLKYQIGSDSSGSASLFPSQQRNLSQTLTKTDKRQSIFRTEESNPVKHGKIHDGLYYKIPSDVASRLFVLGGFDKEQQLMLKAFQETAIMIRNPALEIISYLNKTDFSKPPNRFVLCKL